MTFFYLFNFYVFSYNILKVQKVEIIKLKSAKNYRDIGNIRLKDGTILPTGKYYRGKTLYKVKNKDLKILTEKYHIKTIIDLRTDKELKEKPNPEIPGVTILHLPIFDAEKAGVSRDKKSVSLASLKISPEMVDVYKTMADDECTDNIKTILETILSLEEDQLPVLFHCSAGKDRTGVISALLLKYFGADDEAIYEDYLYTNKDGFILHRFLCIAFAIVFFNIRLAKKLSRVFKADKKYLDSFFGVISEKFGSVENFVKTLKPKK